MSKDDKSNELIELKQKYGFWLKPVAKLNITVQLPQLSSGKAISTTSVMEKINKRAKVQFKSLKITKTTIDFLRFEGELETLKELDIVEQRLNRVKIKLDGFDEQLKLKANKVKIGPFKHDWETFFRDNHLMDELKPGYRPDTVLIQNLPLKWFSNNDTLKTNWLISVFSVFGDIRRFHIPLLDEIEKEKHKQDNHQLGFKKFNFNSENATFDVYLMYKDYVGFVNAMDGLRGVKLVKCLKNSDNRMEYIEHDIKLDFDRTKHLSDKAIRRRQIAKKYGINTFEDLNEYKKKAKERKILYEHRMKQIKKEKKRSKNLLNFLARLIVIKEKKREEEEQRTLNERLLKERLIEEEKKLRNKLIERQRNLQLKKVKEQNVPKDDRKSLNNSSNNQKNFCDSEYFNYSNRDSLHCYESDNKDYSSNYRYRSLNTKTSNFINKNANLTTNNQYRNYDFDNHIDSFNYKKQNIPRPLNYKSHFNSYQANMITNRNYYSSNQHKPNLCDSRSNYVDESLNEKSYGDKLSSDRSYDDRSIYNKSYDRSFYNKSYDKSYNRQSYEKKFITGKQYNERLFDRQNHANKFHNIGRSYHNNKSYNRSFNNKFYDDKSFVDKSFRDQYDEKSNLHENLYNKYCSKSNSYDKMRNPYEEIRDKPKEEKSLKSFVVLPKR